MRAQGWPRSIRATPTWPRRACGAPTNCSRPARSRAWFAGRELVDALAVRVAAAAGHSGLAADRFERALALAEPNDAFAAARLVAECAPALAAMGVRTVEATIERVRYAAIASGFDRLVRKLSQ